MDPSIVIGKKINYNAQGNQIFAIVIMRKIKYSVLGCQVFSDTLFSRVRELINTLTLEKLF